MAKTNTPKRKEAVRSQLAEHLVEAAVPLFFAQGFAETTTRQISEACGVTPGALYVHYSSKTDLLHRLIIDTFGKVESAILEAMEQARGDPARQLSAMVYSYAWYHAAFPEAATVSNREFRNLDESRLASVLASRRQIERLFVVVMDEGLKAGTFRPVRSQDPNPERLLTIAILNMCLRISEWYDPKGPLSPEEIGEIHAALAMRMVK